MGLTWLSDTAGDSEAAEAEAAAAAQQTVAVVIAAARELKRAAQSIRDATQLAVTLDWPTKRAKLS
jgi:hypothetical protein